MASNQDEGSVRSVDDTTSSLGDSAYDFVDDSSFATTDDEEPVLAGRSTAERNHEPSDSGEMERTISLESIRAHPEASLEQTAMRSSVYSTSSEDGMFYRSMPHQQPAVTQPMPHSIRYLDIHHGEGTFPLNPASAPQNLAVTVRQHILDQTLSLDGPYRLLYIGNAAARERIVAKIGAALASTHRDETLQPLRYSVVPLPFSDDPECSSEPILLDWSAHEIIVYHCVSAWFGRRDSGHDTIELSMDGDIKVQSSWDGSKFDLTKGWELPDISIFYLSDRDGVSAKQTRRLARSFVARHKIPTFLVSEKPAWERPSEAITIERFSPHICLQTKNENTPSCDVVKRLPIDLSTLVRLDARQLNQNLAYLAHASGTPRTRNEIQYSSKLGDRSNLSERLGVQPTWLAIWDCLATARSGLSYIPALIVFTFICSFILSQLSSFPVRSIDQGVNSVANCSNTLVHVSPMLTTSIGVSSSKPTMPPSLTVPSPAKLVQPQPTLAKKAHTDLATLLESIPMRINKSERFQVHVLGDAHIVLRPPHWFTRSKKTPKLEIEVTRNDRALKHRLSVLFDGVYALELPIDEARGAIDISVWTTSKPKIRENFQVDLGNSWLRAVGWKKALNAVSGSFRQDLDAIQTSLGAIITRSGAEVDSLIQEALGRAEQLKVETQTIRKESIRWMANLTNRISASTRNVSTGVLRFLEQRKVVVGKGMSGEAEKWRRKAWSYVSGKARVARIYAEATPAAYRIQLRKTQKKALRAWWSMAGLPQPRPVRVACKGNSRFCGEKPKERVFSK